MQLSMSWSLFQASCLTPKDDFAGVMELYNVDMPNIVSSLYKKKPNIKTKALATECLIIHKLLILVNVLKTNL